MSKLIDRMNIEEVSNQKEVRDAFPSSLAETAGFPVACWSYDTPYGIRISNEKGAIMSAHKICKHSCRCHLLPDKFKDASGHVVTTDLSVINNASQRKLMEKGTTFRDQFMEANPQNDKAPKELAEISESLSAYVEKSAKLNDVPIEWFE